MHAAILAPGPSLRQTFDPDHAGLRIGVNRAATAYACDIWAALDLPLILEHSASVAGSPSLFTIAATLESLIRRAHPFATRGRHTAESLFAYLPPHALSWTLYTLPGAVVLAAKLGAERIDVYGADWQAEAADFDGVMGGMNRSQERFARESEIFANLTEALSVRGVTVRRVTL